MSSACKIFLSYSISVFVESISTYECSLSLKYARITKPVASNFSNALYSSFVGSAITSIEVITAVPHLATTVISPLNPFGNSVINSPFKYQPKNSTVPLVGVNNLGVSPTL